MTPSDVDSVLARRRGTVARQNAQIARAPRVHSALAAGLHLPYAIGQRVFDTVLGAHGHVVGGAPYGAKDGARVDVQLASGDVVTRQPAHVVPRPTPPPPRS